MIDIDNTREQLLEILKTKEILILLTVENPKTCSLYQ